MPYPKDITYPATATNAAWQKQKSFLDKAKSKNKTGVGPKLVAAEAAWGQIPFADLDESKNKPTTSVQSQASLTKAIAADHKVVLARKALNEAIAIATTRSTSGDLTGTSKTALKAIATALKAASLRLEGMDDLVAMFQIDHNNVVKDEAEKAKAAQAKAAKDRADKEKADKANLAVLTHVEVKSGSSVVATGTKATRQTDDAYWVTGTAWKTVGRNDDLTYLQKKLTLEGKGQDGTPFSKVMTLSSIVGDGTLKFK